MKAYFYTPKDLGIEKFQPGLMRLAGFNITENPHDADVWCLPAIMHHFSKEKLLNLKYLDGREERHVVWDCADNFRTFGVPWIAIRCATTKKILEADPTTIAWPWPVEPLWRPLGTGNKWDGLPDEFQHDVGFWGWRTPMNLTDRACDSVLREICLSSEIFRSGEFFGYKRPADADFAELRWGFIANLHGSRLSLVPASIDGVARYRFYEHMSIGRGQPIHICDNIVLPWQSKINYDYIVPDLGAAWPEGFDSTGISLPESRVDDVGPLLVEWLADHTDEYIKSAGAYAREMFDAWLHRDRWDILFGLAVKERLEGKI